MHYCVLILQTQKPHHLQLLKLLKYFHPTVYDVSRNLREYMMYNLCMNEAYVCTCPLSHKQVTIVCPGPSDLATCGSGGKREEGRWEEKEKNE